MFDDEISLFICLNVTSKFIDFYDHLRPLFTSLLEDLQFSGVHKETYPCHLPCYYQFFWRNVGRTS